MGFMDKLKDLLVQRDPGATAEDAPGVPPSPPPSEASLQDRIEALAEGATLSLFPQEYGGPIFLRRRMILDGQGSAIYAKQGPVVVVESDGVIMRNFRIEVTDEEPAPDEARCAVWVHPNKGFRPENIEVKGTVIGLPNEAGDWYYPFSLYMGHLAHGREHDFRLRIYVPVECQLISNISGFSVEPRQLAAGPHEIRIHLGNLLRDTLINGVVTIATGLFKRQMHFNAHVSEASRDLAPIMGTGQVLYEAPNWSVLMTPPEPESPEVEVLPDVPVEAPPASLPVYPREQAAEPEAGAAPPAAQAQAPEPAEEPAKPAAETQPPQPQSPPEPAPPAGGGGAALPGLPPQPVDAGPGAGQEPAVKAGPDASPAVTPPPAVTPKPPPRPLPPPGGRSIIKQTDPTKLQESFFGVDNQPTAEAPGAPQDSAAPPSPVEKRPEPMVPEIFSTAPPPGESGSAAPSGETAPPPPSPEFPATGSGKPQPSPQDAVSPFGFGPPAPPKDAAAAGKGPPEKTPTSPREAKTGKKPGIPSLFFDTEKKEN